MTESLTPSTEQLRSWLTEDDRFPDYYYHEHDQYLRGLIAEVLEYRELKAGMWALEQTPKGDVE